jgi:hypothetical protein
VDTRAGQAMKNEASQMIKPIETLDRGYRFRSRLEARWAVFFDRCRESFAYEHEGFRLPSGPYLPDFFFPHRQGFVEVKPISQLPVRNFSFGIGDNDALFDDEGLPREIIQISELSRLLRLSPLHCVVVYGDPYDVMHPDEGGGAVHVSERNRLMRGIGFIDLFHASLFDAADAARCARFEHGECV